MSRFLEWRFRLGPIGFGMGLRTVELRDALPDSNAVALPPADLLAVGTVRLVEDTERAEPKAGSAG